MTFLNSFNDLLTLDHSTLGHLCLILEDYSFRAYDFVDQGLDVAVRLGDLPDSSLVARKIATLQWIVCAAPEYLARRGEPKTPADLSQHACLAHVNLDPNDHAWRLHNSDHVISAKIASAFSSNSALVLRKAALASLGIGYLPRYCIDEDLKSAALRQLLPKYCPPERPIYVVYPPASRISERVRTFVDFLAEWFGNSSAAESRQNSRRRHFARGTVPTTLRPISRH